MKPSDFILSVMFGIFHIIIYSFIWNKVVGVPGTFTDWFCFVIIWFTTNEIHYFVVNDFLKWE